jgi:hypothetical protein
MFRWYQNATRCYVFLTDVHSVTLGSGPFVCSRWFTRGWTLQELLAPRSVEFFTSEGSYIGQRESLQRCISEATGIPSKALYGSSLLAAFSVEERLSWAERRETKREEDVAYSLLGLFDVHMPLIYGEGRKKAMKRLRKEIVEAQAEIDWSSINSEIHGHTEHNMLNSYTGPSVNVDTERVESTSTQSTGHLQFLDSTRSTVDRSLTDIPDRAVVAGFPQEYYVHLCLFPDTHFVRDS